MAVVFGVILKSVQLWLVWRLETASAAKEGRMDGWKCALF
jgi:hypothetical protein